MKPRLPISSSSATFKALTNGELALQNNLAPGLRFEKTQTSDELVHAATIRQCCKLHLRRLAVLATVELIEP